MGNGEKREREWIRKCKERKKEGRQREREGRDEKVEREGKK